MRIGVVSDTHGFLPQALLEALDGVDSILHAGDVGSQAVLDALAEVAPVYAVHGNNDIKFEGFGLPEHLDIELEGLRLHVVHELPKSKPGPDTRVVVFGHSHRCVNRERDGVLYLNPGAAGRVGFHTVQTFALLDLQAGEARATIIELGPRRPVSV